MGIFDWLCKKDDEVFLPNKKISVIEQERIKAEEEKKKALEKANEIYQQKVQKQIENEKNRNKKEEDTLEGANKALENTIKTYEKKVEERLKNENDKEKSEEKD